MGKPTLRFRPDGTFRVLMFSDLHIGEGFDDRTTDAMSQLIDGEQPDFVMLAGDILDGGVPDAATLRESLGRMVEPMETRGIPWAHVYGNHDEDHAFRTGLTAALQQNLYEAYPHCLSERGPEGIGGVGNFVLPVLSSQGDRIAFAIWGLDSGRFLHTNDAWYGRSLHGDAILDANMHGTHDYDFIKFGQLAWYWETSMGLEKREGRRVPGIMFLHIPLPEHRMVPMNPNATGMTGVKGEDECNSPINSGLFSAILQRGDVKGVFCGHDHVNDYTGTYCGVMLGYDAGIGFTTYGFKDDGGNPRRGGRVIILDETAAGPFSTRMGYVSGGTVVS